ncbi:hypothetical protein JW935_11235 [candidate division KSB1 bacterium]|nr:hypothetical protein [candidate division KSB1 bacterium]
MRTNKIKQIQIVKLSENNPVTDMNKVLGDVNDFFTRLADKFHVSFMEFENFLKNNHSELKVELDLFYDRIDIDVFGKFRNGTLTKDIYVTWKNDLLRWKSKMETAIQIFAVEKFGQVIEKPVSELFVELAA